MAMAAPSGPVFFAVPLDDWRHDANPDQTALLTTRNVSARPTPPLAQLKTLADRLNSARNPLFVVGNEIDTDEGWKAGVDLADKCGAGVYLTIEPARISFPTQDPNFLGTLGTPIAIVRKQLTGHDLVVVFGAPVFRYHAWSPGSYLPDGTQVVMITADPDQAARAPHGRCNHRGSGCGNGTIASSRQAKAIEIASQKKYVRLVPLWKRQNHRETI